MSFARWINLLPVVPAAACLGLLAGCDDGAWMNHSTASVKLVADADFTNEVLRCAQPVAIDFFATWCGPCKAFSPMFDRAADAYAGKIKFVKVNVDQSPEAAALCQVQAIPALLLFKDGKLVDRMAGLPEETDLKARLEAFSNLR